MKRRHDRRFDVVSVERAFAERRDDAVQADRGSKAGNEKQIGGGRVPASELLMIGYGARQHIRKNALQHLNQEITITRKNGSFTLEESLADLVQRGLVTAEDARTRTIHLEELDSLMRGAKTTL